MKKLCIVSCIASFFYLNEALESSAGMPQLNPEFWPSQVFWLILTFSILYLIIWKIFLPKITYTIENRKSKIVQDLDEAQKLKESAEKKLKEYNKTIFQHLLKKKKTFNDQIEKEIVKIEKEIKDLKKTSLSNISKIASETSVELIKKIINTEVNQSNVSAVVNEVAKRNMEKNL